MSKPAILTGGPYDGTVGEISRPLPVLYFGQGNGFAYALTTPQPHDAPSLTYAFSEEMSPAVIHAKQNGLWDPTPREEMN